MIQALPNIPNIIGHSKWVLVVALIIGLFALIAAVSGKGCFKARIFFGYFEGGCG